MALDTMWYVNSKLDLIPCELMKVMSLQSDEECKD